MQLAEQRIPEMVTLKSKLADLFDQGHALWKQVMNTVMTELEKDGHERLLHEDMKTYTDCFVVKKDKILALLDGDSKKLNVKLEKAKEYHQNSVS